MQCNKFHATLGCLRPKRKRDRVTTGPVVLALLCAVVLSMAGAAHAGPVLDEILNYMYVDQTVPMQYSSTMFTVSRTITLTSSQPIGQVFVAGLDTENIARIRAYVQPGGNWQPGEGAKMTVWDSPDKNTSFGDYTIWYDFRGYQRCVAEFEVDADVNPGNTYYLEITYVGDGDGVLCAIGVMNGQYNYEIMRRVIHVDASAPPGGDGTSWAKAYNTMQDAIDGMEDGPTGQGYLGGQPADFDLCFQTHGQKRLDSVGNLKKTFDRFDLDRPELAQIKQSVAQEDFASAVSQTVAYFEARQDPITIITPGLVPNPDPGYDTTDGDYAMQNIYWSGTHYGYVGPDINWRPALEFNANGHITASAFTMNRFMPRGILANAYLGTGDHNYAKKLNDLLADWFMDNPPPEDSGIGGAPIDDVWASLNTGIRLGHGFVAYDRIHSSPEFTTDCRFAYILDLADHADTLVWNGGDAGGNWSMTQNSALIEFALNFQEFKNWQLWFDTACDRLSLTINNDILPDGVETESAPGYQRWMYYGPLVGVYQLLLDRGVQTPFSAELRDILETQAEYFMYWTMPDLGGPELGDWGGNAAHFLLSDAELFDRSDMLYVGTSGAEGTKPAEVSKCYPYAGIVTMRSDWGDVGLPFEDSRYMMCHGVHYGAHGHADLNGVTVYAYGRELLADPGSHIYGSPEHALLTEAVSHNLMTIDGQNQNNFGDTPFREWATTPIADYLSSWIPAYNAGNYHREIFYIRSNGDAAQDYWVIRDKAEGGGTHSLEQRWHFKPTDVTVAGGTLTATTGHEDGGNLAIMQITPSRLQAQQTTIDSWIPRGTSEPPTQLPTVIYTTSTALPAAIDSLLLPYEGIQMPQAQLVTIQTSSDGLDSVFKLTQGTVSDLFIFQRTAGAVSVPSENVSFDGERLFLRTDNGVVRSLAIVNGSSLTVNGVPVVDLPEPQPWYAVSFEAGAPQVYQGSLSVDAKEEQP